MKTIVLILVVLLSINSFGQRKDNPKAFMDSLKVHQDFQKYCRWKFKKERNVGLELIGAGALMAIGIQMDKINGFDKAINKYNDEIAVARLNINSYRRMELETYAAIHYNDSRERIETTKDVLTYTGCAMAAVGLILNINNYRWLRRAYADENGIGVRFYLDK